MTEISFRQANISHILLLITQTTTVTVTMLPHPLNFCKLFTGK